MTTPSTSPKVDRNNTEMTSRNVISARKSLKFASQRKVLPSIPERDKNNINNSICNTVRGRMQERNLPAVLPSVKNLYKLIEQSYEMNDIQSFKRLNRLLRKRLHQVKREAPQDNATEDGREAFNHRGVENEYEKNITKTTIAASNTSARVINANKPSDPLTNITSGAFCYHTACGSCCYECQQKSTQGPLSE
jgi:hypothetical protein